MAVKMSLLSITDKGIYCEQAGVYIDPWKSVEKALITHAHSDHARPGHKSYLAHHTTAPIVKHRLSKAKVQGIEYGEKININGVQFSFHPAGHIIGSAQIRVEYQGRVEVASGDYKLEYDGISQEFEPIKCQHFITESTFGLPVFKWESQKQVFEEINNWWKQNKAEQKVSVLTAYSLGKAQRLIHNLDQNIGKIFTHNAIEKVNHLFREIGVDLAETQLLESNLTNEDLVGNMIISTPSGIGSQWMEKIKPISIGMASGWMALRSNRKRRGADIGFVLSDHADWDGLLEVIKMTEAEEITVTHGYTETFAQWLRDEGYLAKTAKTSYTGEILMNEDQNLR